MRYTGGAGRRRLHASALAGICAAGLLAGAVGAGVAARPPAAGAADAGAADTGAAGLRAAADTVVRTASGTWVVEGRGFGHGRGMAQWGARAAAAKGVSAERILAFYYPGTVRTQVGNPTLRVKVGDDPELVLAPARGLVVRWAGGRVAVPARAGVTRWKVGAYGSRLRLAALGRTGWAWWGPVLPAQVDVASAAATLRVHWRDRTATELRGVLAVTRTVGGRVTVVDRLPMESYLAGVVPRESPASWPAQSLRAQAVAARTYAYAALRRPRATRWDLCDTTACQVYGGARRLRADGTRLSGEEPATTAAVAGTAGVVLLSAGRPATTEYSASNGGWTAAGRVPYLVAKADPNVVGDPYARWQVRVSSAGLGRAFGFARLDRLRVTARTGAGSWGGRVLEAELVGLDGVGKPRAVRVTGGAVRSALGLRSTYFHLRQR